MSHLQNLLNRALQLHQSGRIQEAINLYETLIRYDETNAQLNFLLGTGYLQLGKNEQGLRHLDKVFEQYPSRTDVLVNRGIALKEVGRYEEAIASFDRAISIKPDLAEAYSNCGNALMKLKRYEESIHSYDKAIELKSDYADAYMNRSAAFHELKQFEKALASAEIAISLNAHDAEAYFIHGNALQDLKRLNEALASYDKALTLKPDLVFLAGLRLHLKMKLSDWAGFSEEIESIVKDVQQSKPAVQPFVMLGLVDQPELHLMTSKIYADEKYKMQDAPSLIDRRPPGEKIRVGYYSADFRSHAVSFATAEMFELHDRSRFEVYGFSLGLNANDEMRQRICAGVDYFIDVRTKNDREIARLSREIGIDIAIDLGGYTLDSRTGIFIERAAPIQVNYLGYPGTMGVDYIDYIVADKIVIPTERQSDFTEKVVYLPNSYFVNDSKRRISDTLFLKEELGLPENGFVFCCFNSNYKILPATFDGWMRILKAVDGSVLWLADAHPTAVANLRKEAEQRGIDGSRLVFAKRLPALDDHLARYRYADLFIDSLPYNAHTTCSDALWAGLPVLTCTGQSFASRVAASLLNAINLPELVTHTQEGYEATAIELATHPSKLCEIKIKLEHNRLTAPLFNGKLFVKHLETAYEMMLARYQAGLPPDSLVIQQ